MDFGVYSVCEVVDDDLKFLGHHFLELVWGHVGCEVVFLGEGVDLILEGVGSWVGHDGVGCGLEVGLLDALYESEVVCVLASFEFPLDVSAFEPEAFAFGLLVVGMIGNGHGWCGLVLWVYDLRGKAD